MKTGHAFHDPHRRRLLRPAPGGRTPAPPSVSGLRRVASKARDNGSVHAARLLEWAADTIDTQRAEIARLRRLRETPTP